MRNAAANETANIDADESEDNGDDGDDDENGSGRGMEEPPLRNWKPRRQFNSALGIGIDAPMSPPQSNAYDVHNSQQGPAPWESSYGGRDAYVR